MSIQILLVDEDRLLKDLLIRTLTSNNCEVVDAHSIAAAKTMIVDRPPDLVITDAHLSEGVPFIFTLQMAQTPVIALVKTDHQRDQFRLAEIRAVDRRGSLAALVN